MFVQTDSSPSLPPPFTHFTHCHRSSSSPSSLLISICWVELEYFHDLENQTAFAKMWHSWALGKGWVEGRAAATKGLVGQSQARLRSRLTTFQSQIQRRIKDHAAAAAATVIIFLVNIIINSQRYLSLRFGWNKLFVGLLSQHTIHQFRIHWITASLSISTSRYYERLSGPCLLKRFHSQI